jgi:pimeloyl-ACP methyl ester carboxylesterase
VDAERVALLGASMGGLLAPRAAAFEPRVKAVIAFDGVYDMSLVMAQPFGGDREAALAALGHPDADAHLYAAAAQNPVLRWAITHGMWALGADSPAAFARAYMDYHLRDGVAERIACPALVCAAPDDFAFKGQPEALYEHLTCEKTFMTFTAAEGADAHCQSGAQRLALARIADWLERTWR